MSLRNRILLAVVTTFALLAAENAQAGTIRHDVSDSLYTALAEEEVYDAVGMFLWSLDGGSSGLASGTLISGDWVLTAGHVIDDATVDSMTFTLDGTTYNVTEMIAYDGWTGDVSIAGDLALVRLEEVVDSVTPALLYTGDEEVGSEATIVGYGSTGDGMTGYIYDAGTKRAGNNLIGGLGDVIGYSEHSLMADFDYPDPNATAKAICLDLEYLAAPGDSGGGWFIEEDGVSYLAGVTSFGYATDGNIDSDYGDIMGATRVSDYLEWIYSVIFADYIAGDLNGDGYVGMDDLDLILTHWNTDVTPGDFFSGDADGDGFIGLDDLDVILANWNQGTAPSNLAALPEPGSLFVMIPPVMYGWLKRRPATT